MGQGQVCSLAETFEAIALEGNEFHEDSGVLFADLQQQSPQSSCSASRSRGQIFSQCSYLLLNDVFEVDRSEPLGTGTYGHVFRATAKGVGGPDVAIKTFSRPRDLGRDPGLHQMWRVRCGIFNEERAVLAGLEHPHITQLLGSFTEEAALHLVMEMCTGGDLFSCIKAASRLTEMRAQPIFWQMTRAASYLHRMHVIHRDVKPENWLFVRRDVDTIKLCDFGSAVQLTFTRPRTHQLGGTIVYQAPEIHLGHGGGAAADDWGLGAVLYTMLVGRHPFKIPQIADELCAEQICRGNFDRGNANWVGLTPAAQRLIESFLIVDEKQRMSSSASSSNSWVALGASSSNTPASIRVGAAKAFQLARIVSSLDPLQRLILVVCARLPHKLDEGAVDHPWDLSNNGQSDVKAAVATDLSARQAKITSLGYEKQVGGGYVSQVPWYGLFMHLDRDGDGRLIKSELVDGLAQLMGPSVHDKEVIDSLDVDGNGYIDWGEWCMLELLEKLSFDDCFSEHAWRTAHRLLDGPTGDGLISFHDLGILPGFGQTGECNKLLHKWSNGTEVAGTSGGCPGLAMQDLQHMFKSIKRPHDLVIM